MRRWKWDKTVSLVEMIGLDWTIIPHGMDCVKQVELVVMEVVFGTELVMGIEVVVGIEE